MSKGFAFICNQKFEIVEIVYNSFKNRSWNVIGQFIGDICDPEEENKVQGFIKLMKEDAASFSWEMNVPFDDHLETLKFSGSKINGSYLIFALEINSDVPFLYEELLRINNEQTNFIRKILKERFLNSEIQNQNDQTFDDITKLNNELSNLQRELAKKNVELSRLNEIKNQFLGMAAHDLRNPLGNVFNFAELLEEEFIEITPRQSKYINHIKNQSLFMVNMVNDLLDFSAIESGKINLAVQRNDLVNSINEVVSLTQTLATKKSISFQIDIDDHPIELEYDHEKIQQVITNLITNAIKFSESNTNVFIAIHEKSDEYILEVRDEGQGIKAEEAAALFSPFKRSSARPTGGEKSTGLGLFICKKIIEAHKGKIWVESKLGVGSSFFFSLPKKKDNYE